MGAYAYPAEGTGDPDEGLYLVVWRYCEGNDCDVHGRRVAIEKGEFEVYNETITIASGSGRQQSPDVAYQPGLGRWVVVWEDDAGEDYDIYGRLVSPDGTLDGSDYAIASESEDDRCDQRLWQDGRPSSEATSFVLQELSLIHI